MKRIVVLGAGESGAGAAVLAKAKGFEVFVSDMSAIKNKYKTLLNAHNIEWEEGQQNSECRRGYKKSRHSERSSHGEKTNRAGYAHYKRN